MAETVALPRYLGSRRRALKTVAQSVRDRTDVMSGLVAYSQQPFHLSDGNQAERVTGQIVSENYFAVLGVRPASAAFFCRRRIPRRAHIRSSSSATVCGGGVSPPIRR